MKTSFFDYYRRAIKEGCTQTEAYHYALVEDIYDAEDNLLPKDYKHPEPFCFHPQFAIKEVAQSEGLCEVCGSVVIKDWHSHAKKYLWRGIPARISRRSEFLEPLFEIFLG